MCYKTEWDDVIKLNETDQYVIPRGWMRFGLKLPPRAAAIEEEFFSKWSVSFHGAAANVCKNILATGMIMIPGDRLLDGTELRSERCAGRQDRVFYTSPTVSYAGLQFYATPTHFVDPAGRDMLGQVT